MNTFYLSYLMGASQIKDKDLEHLDIKIMAKKESGSRKLKVPQESLSDYIELIKNKLNKGFWNEVVGAEEIIFIFKFKDETIKEFRLSTETEAEISRLATKFNNDPLDKTANVYKYISNNDFYHDFMIENYKKLIDR